MNTRPIRIALKRKAVVTIEAFLANDDKSADV
jgi:hypothetical protein